MRAFVITMGDVARCPKGSLSPRHFHEDGTCKCAERTAAAAEVAAAEEAAREVRDRLAAARARLADC